MKDGKITRVTDVPGLGDPRRFGYAHAVIARGMIFLAGQMGIDEDYQVVAHDFASQARTALRNVSAALDQCGASAADLATMTVYLTDMRDSAQFFEIRKQEFGDILVASTTVAVAALPLPGLRVEVQCVALLPGT